MITEDGTEVSSRNTKIVSICQNCGKHPNKRTTTAVTFDRSYGNETVPISERSEHSSDSWGSTSTSEREKSQQQPNLICGSYTQIMVNLMHEFTACLDRLVEARRNRQDKRQRLYRAYRKPYNEA